MKRLEFKGVPVQNTENFYAVTPSETKPTGNFYFLSNDVLTLRVDAAKEAHDVVVCGVANPHFFHVIDLVSRKRAIKRVIAVDYNYDQLVHFQRIHSLILASQNRIDFLQRLFKVTFNAKAIKLLTSVRPPRKDHVRGGVDKDNFFTIEQEIWRNCTFHAEEFYATYGVRAEPGDGGLLINSSTIGDIDTYYATFLCCSRSDYEHWPFTIAFGSGLLQDEVAFRRTSEVLWKAPLYLLQGDFSVLYPDLLSSNRYSPLFVWCSNLLCDYFLAKNPNLESIATLSLTLGTRVEPQFPEIDVVLLQDERTYRAIAEPIDNRRKHRRYWSVHTRTFAVASRYLSGGNNLEVIGVKSWYDQDFGVSKLPNTDYCMLEEFCAAAGVATHYDSILLHILSGHCTSAGSYAGVLKKARGMTDNLVILEHNRLSRDFRGTGDGVTVDEVRDILGAESFLDFGPGERCADRNIVMVYRN